MKFKLKKKDAYDLSLVTGAIVRDEADSLDFKEIIHLQKASNDILSAVPDFEKEYKKISEEKQSLAKAANAKITAYKEKELPKAEKAGNSEEFKKGLDDFTQLMIEETTLEAEKLITPQFNALYDGIGEEEVEIDLEKERLDIVVDNFEKYAKKQYTNKSRMIEVYDAIKAAV